MVDRYAKFATENLAVTAGRIEAASGGSNVIQLSSRFPHVADSVKTEADSQGLDVRWLPELGSNQRPAD